MYAFAVLVGTPFVLASVGAFAPAVVYSYLMHDRWTFRTKAPTGRGLLRWLGLQTTVLVLNTMALWGLVEGVHVHRLLAQALLLPLIPPTTYFLGRRHVFGAGGKETFLHASPPI